VSGDDLGDVRRQPVQDGIRDEEPPEVMRSEVQRPAGRVSQAGAGERLGEDGADRRRADRPAL
jgi:hypothetical protein